MKVVYEFEVDDDKAAAMHARLWEPGEEVEGSGRELVADLAASCPSDFFDHTGLRDTLISARLLIDGEEVELRIDL